MNNQLITKLIKFNNKSCPDIVYENPLLDRNLATELAKSLVKILGSRQNSNVGNNLNQCVLDNIRKLCQMEADGHKKIDENMMAMVTDLYNVQIAENSAQSSDDCVNRQLDAFLMREMKDIDLSSSFQPELNPEVVQALINVNNQGAYLEKLSSDLIHWNTKSEKHQNLVKDLWKSDYAHEIFTGTNIIDDIAIKMKAELEKELLEISSHLLINKETDVIELFESNSMIQNIVKKCAASPVCFQICSAIVNTIFITTNLNPKLHEFIITLVKSVRNNIPPHTFTSLYPANLTNVVLLLDRELEAFDPVKDVYISYAMEYLKRVEVISIVDFIMLLSHYPQWFNLYFSNQPLA